MRGRKGIAVVAIINGRGVGKIFHSLTSCAKELGLQESHVSEVLSGKRRHHKGYTFKPLYRDYGEKRRKRRINDHR